VLYYFIYINAVNIYISTSVMITHVITGVYFNRQFMVYICESS